MGIPEVGLKEGIHVMHLFYRVERTRWAALDGVARAESLRRLEAHCTANAQPCQPRIDTYANVGNKADLAFMLYSDKLGDLSRMHRDLEAAFPAGTLVPVYSFLSITELSEYTSTEEDYRRMLVEQEKMDPDSEAFTQRLEAMNKKRKEYEHYRLYPELPAWEVMGFYPMNKRREGADNWYSLDLPARKKLMGGHARVGRAYAGRVSQLITSCTGIDDWEWGVTLMAHQVDALRDIVYEMRFDEVSARYGEFGTFYINLRMDPATLWNHLGLD